MKQPEHTHLAPSYAEISLGNLRHNVRLLASRASPAGLMGVIKANAYGHGAVEIVPTLRAEGVGHFAVATVPEALELREHGIEEPILVLTSPLESYLPACVASQLDVNVSSMEIAEAVVRTSRAAGPLRVHVKIDTGMGRLGLQPNEVLPVLRLLERAPGVTVVGVWTHFANADELHSEFAKQQLLLFRQVLGQLSNQVPLIHAANSGALLSLPDSVRFDNALARTGITMYGYPPSDEVGTDEDLLPVMRFCSRILHIKTVEAGTPISYGCTWKAPQKTRIATISAGYADGYPRLVSNRALIGIRGHLYPQVGRVCMDMCMVDLGPPDLESSQSIHVGEEAVLFGDGGPTGRALAQWAETIPYEIVCRITSRVPRIYCELFDIYQS